MSGYIKVWDPLVRVFHWALVAAFTIAWITADEFEGVHIYAGYTVLGLILFRLVWGLIGTRHARFSDFVFGPASVLGYLKELLGNRAPRYLGHNPAGGVMVLALIVGLLFTSFAGLAALGAEGDGPLAGTWFAGEAFEEMHEFLANLMLLLVGIHIAAVFVTSALHGENLIRAMITGRKQQDG